MKSALPKKYWLTNYTKTITQLWFTNYIEFRKNKNVNILYYVVLSIKRRNVFTRATMTDNILKRELLLTDLKTNLTKLLTSTITIARQENNSDIEGVIVIKHFVGRPKSCSFNILKNEFEMIRTWPKAPLKFFFYSISN